jgi:hypothetical protein
MKLTKKCIHIKFNLSKNKEAVSTIPAGLKCEGEDPVFNPYTSTLLLIRVSRKTAHFCFYQNQTLTSCSKNLSSIVLSPVFVPAPSNKTLYC